MEKICNSCRQFRKVDILNVKCMDCEKLICDLCLDDDFLNGIKCNRCDYKWWENRLRQLIEETTYVRSKYFELKKKEEDHFYLDNISGI